MIKYHQQFYRPQNMCIIVIGKVDYNKLKQLIDNIEINTTETIESIKRPWVSDNRNEIEVFKEEIVEKFEFPSEEEDNGEVCVCIRGREHNDIVSYLEYKILLEYLYIMLFLFLYRFFLFILSFIHCFYFSFLSTYFSFLYYVFI